MIAKAIDALLSVGKKQADPIIREFHGGEYALINGQWHPMREPKPEPVKFSTLAGLCQYAKENRDQLDLDQHFAVVESPTKVSLRSNLDAVWQTRDSVAAVEPPARAVHHFATWVEQEQFSIWLQSSFARTDDLSRVLQIVGGLKAEHVQTLDDDGVTQLATVRKGVSRTSQVEVKNPVLLRPFRTFAEVEQPASNFILRLQEKEGQTPLCALFDVQDGAWVGQAMASIKAALEEGLQGTKLTVLV